MFPSSKELQAMNQKILDRLDTTNTILLTIARMMQMQEPPGATKDDMNSIIHDLSQAIKMQIKAK